MKMRNGKNWKLTPVWGWFLWTIIVVSVLHAALRLFHHHGAVDVIGILDDITTAMALFIVWLWQRQTKRILKDVEAANDNLGGICTGDMYETDKERYLYARKKLEAWL